VSLLDIPRHVAIIMDGNGRWAKSKKMSLIKGHRKGADVAREITEKAAQLGVKTLTLYAFSFENWRRDNTWIEDFMVLLRWFLKDQLKDLMDNGVKIRAIGEVSLMPEDIQKSLKDVEEKTKNNTKITVQLALSYSGRNEIIRAVNKILAACKDGAISEDKPLDEKNFEKYLDTGPHGDPELIIRTSGEKRISNFLLWQMAYSELHFSDKLWPDYTGLDFEEAIRDYQNRERRFGA
jgi:undecaprenyl diphosphate synthase